MMKDELRLWRLAVSDREIVNAEARSIGYLVVRCAFYSFMGVAVTSVAYVASIWPIDGIEWNAQAISEAYGYFRATWILVFLMCLAASPFFYVSPISQVVRRLQEYDKLSTRELLVMRDRLKQKMEGNTNDR